MKIEICDASQNRRQKYGNKKTKIDGILFDSKKEAARYCQLKAMLRGGIIRNLELQKRYEIVPKTTHGRALYYVSDFTYELDGQIVVEDAKGVRTQVYALKKRLMIEKYGIVIKEV